LGVLLVLGSAAAGDQSFKVGWPVHGGTLRAGAKAVSSASLRTMTAPCLQSRDCCGRWIPAPEEAPEEFQLNAVNVNGTPF